MHKTVGLVALLTTLAIAIPALAQDKPILAVMEIEDKTGKFTDTQIQEAATYLRSKLEVAGTFMVVAKSRQDEALIQEMRKESYKACYAERCQIQLGEKLAADTILKSRVTEFAGTCTLASAIISLGSATSVGGASADFDCSEKGLKGALDKVLGKVLGGDAAEKDAGEGPQNLVGPGTPKAEPPTASSGHLRENERHSDSAGLSAEARKRLAEAEGARSRNLREAEESKRKQGKILEEWASVEKFALRKDIDREARLREMILFIQTHGRFDALEGRASAIAWKLVPRFDAISPSKEKDARMLRDFALAFPGHEKAAHSAMKAREYYEPATYKDNWITLSVNTGIAHEGPLVGVAVSVLEQRRKNFILSIFGGGVGRATSGSGTTVVGSFYFLALGAKHNFSDYGSNELGFLVAPLGMRLYFRPDDDGGSDVRIGLLVAGLYYRYNLKSTYLECKLSAPLIWAGDGVYNGYFPPLLSLGFGI